MKGIVISYGKCLINFIRISQTVFPSGCTRKIHHPIPTHIFNSKEVLDKNIYCIESYLFSKQMISSIFFIYLCRFLEIC